MTDDCGESVVVEGSTYTCGRDSGHDGVHGNGQIMWIWSGT